MQGLGCMSYKDLKESDGFDPTSLLADDKDDEEFVNVIQKFGRTEERTLSNAISNKVIVAGSNSPKKLTKKLTEA